MIAPSFADIFHNNCFKNGILPIVLPQETIDELMEDAQGDNSCRMTIDLENQQIIRANGEMISFPVDPFRRDCLLKGLDDIGLTLEHEGEITNYEAKLTAERPWLMA